MDITAKSSTPIYTHIQQPLLRFFKDFESLQPFSPKSPQKTPKKQTVSGRLDKGKTTNSDEISSDYTMEYLAELLKEKKQLGVFPQVFRNAERLLDDEVSRVRMAIFHCHFAIDNCDLPESEGEPITIQEKVYVPRKEHPDYNFVGRILGPRGMTAKQLERETGCKIMVRGRGSMRDRRKEEMNRGKPSWEHLDDELHVLVQCEDTPNRVYIKLKIAVEQIKKLLIPAPEGTDELKRKQLMELALINGTYRPINKYSMQTPRLLTPMTVLSPIRHPNGPIAQQIFVSPTGSPMTPGTNVNATPAINTFLPSPNIDYNMIMNQLSFDSGLPSFSMASEYQPHSSGFPTTTSLLNSVSGTNSALHSYFVDSTPITPPGSAESCRH